VVGEYRQNTSSLHSTLEVHAAIFNSELLDGFGELNCKGFIIPDFELSGMLSQPGKDDPIQVEIKFSDLQAKINSKVSITLILPYEKEILAINSILGSFQTFSSVAREVQEIAPFIENSVVPTNLLAIPIHILVTVPKLGFLFHHRSYSEECPVIIFLHLDGFSGSVGRDSEKESISCTVDTISLGTSTSEATSDHVPLIVGAGDSDSKYFFKFSSSRRLADSEGLIFISEVL
jgi:hypothetical protein